MFSSLRWIGNSASGYLKLIDQTRLPLRLTYLECRTLAQVIRAIKRLSVRGAPALGVAAGFGAFIAARGIHTSNFNSFYRRFHALAGQLTASRPTAVNLKWAVDRVNQTIISNKTRTLAIIKNLVFKEAARIFDEDRQTCAAIGRNGAKLIRNNMSILTHCNAGMLATAGLGTALAVLYQAKQQANPRTGGRTSRFKVYATETRPLLQGARLTVWELQRNKIDVTLICDNMAGSLMASGRVDLAIVGADRIARNGDTVNKIGTYQLALLAKAHKIPFYVAAPMSTFDRSIKSGRGIPIEFRSSDEVTHLQGVPIAPKGVRAYNPAFDVTPANLITGWITENGIIRRINLDSHH